MRLLRLLCVFSVVVAGLDLVVSFGVTFVLAVFACLTPYVLFRVYCGLFVLGWVLWGFYLAGSWVLRVICVWILLVALALGGLGCYLVVGLFGCWIL